MTDPTPIPSRRSMSQAGLSETEVLQVLMNWRTRISAAAWAIVRDTHAAEDIFQNVALKAMTRDVTFEAEAALLSWAYITARREALDLLRRSQREERSLDTDILELIEREWQSNPGPSSGTRMEALQSCLEAAPEPARRLLRLRYFEGHSCEEVSARMGIGLNAIYKRVSRLHRDLRDCIERKLTLQNPTGGPTP